jgi:hypothetical protein
MYTKFAITLSIKYPPDTEYPIPTRVNCEGDAPGRSLRADAMAGGLEITDMHRSKHPGPTRGLESRPLGSALRGPLFFDQMDTDSFEPVFPRESVS